MCCLIKQEEHWVSSTPTKVKKLELKTIKKLFKLRYAGTRTLAATPSSEGQYDTLPFGHSASQNNSYKQKTLLPENWCRFRKRFKWKEGTWVKTLAWAKASSPQPEMTSACSVSMVSWPFWQHLPWHTHTSCHTNTCPLPYPGRLQGGEHHISPCILR